MEQDNPTYATRPPPAYPISSREARNVRIVYGVNQYYVIASLDPNITASELRRRIIQDTGVSIEFITLNGIGVPPDEDRPMYIETNDVITASTGVKICQYDLFTSTVSRRTLRNRCEVYLEENRACIPNQ